MRQSIIINKETHLNSGLAQLGQSGHEFARRHVRVWAEPIVLLEDVNLGAREGGPRAALLAVCRWLLLIGANRRRRRTLLRFTCARRSIHSAISGRPGVVRRGRRRGDRRRLLLELVASCADRIHWADANQRLLLATCFGAQDGGCS